MKTMNDETELSEATQDRVVEMYLAGSKTAAITEETGVLRPSIYWILQKRGITPTRTKRGASAEFTTDQLLQRLDAQAREIGRLEAELASKEAALSELISQLGKKK